MGWLSTVVISASDAIEEDFLRWDGIDKTRAWRPHSGRQRDQLMPTSDGELYGFKYVNGRENTAEGLQTVTAWPAR
jgi:ornithine cyclodeaminase